MRKIHAYIPGVVALSAACTLGAAERFKAQTIDDKIQIGYGLAIADVNGDQKKDVLLVDKHEVVWYENPTWQKHVIAEKLTSLDHVSIAADDLNVDGRAEIAVGAGWNPSDTVNSGAVFYLVAPADRREKWKPVQLPHEPTVHRMWFVDGSLVVSPLHGRGNKNGQGDGVRLLEYEMPASPSGEWKTSLVEGTMHMTHNLDPVQWDSDPATELLYCGREGVMLLDKRNQKWTSQFLISPEKNPGFNGAGEVRLGRGESGKVIATIEPMHGTNLVVYTPQGEKWERKVLDSTLADGHAIGWGNVLGQDQNAAHQLVAGWRGKNADGNVGIKLYSRDGSGGWKSEWIDRDGMACEDLKLADLNGDGWLDVIAAGRATKNVKIYWNQGGK